MRIADLDARVEANRRADRRFAARAAQNGGSSLPSGRTSYRRLPDYEANLKNLALRYPNMVRPFTLPYRTHLGRDVMGIEIATDVYNLRDGKPIFLNMGVHHAREWPSSRARHRVGLRPAHQLRQLGPDHAAGAGHAQHRGPDREPGRLQHLA